MSRSTDTEFQLRVKTVQRLLLKGYTRSFVVQFGSEKWGITSRQIDDYIAKAQEVIREINLSKMADNLAVIVSNYWVQYRKACKSKNGFLAVTILEKLSKLQGLDQETVNHVIEVKSEFADLTDEQLDEKFAQGLEQ